MIYLDYAATTPMDEEVLAVYNETAKQYFGNASSLHDIGSKADYLLNICREQFAERLNANAAGIYFTSGGTEANELAIMSLVNGNADKGRHLITTEVEHSSVNNVFRYLETIGYEVTYLPVDRWGKIDLAVLSKSIRSDTILASIHHGNSEIGTVQDIGEIGRVLDENGVIFHADCVQTFGKIPVDVTGSYIDSLSISSHKVYGPKGIGLCYINPQVNWEREIKGITHEGGFRAGTVDLPGIVAFTHAGKLILEQMDVWQKKYAEWRKYFLGVIEQENLPISLVGMSESALPGIIALTFRGTQGQYVMLEYNRHGIGVSTGSACQVGEQNPSRTMLSMGKSTDEAKQLIRISFGKMTTKVELDRLIEITRKVVEGD